MIKIAQAYASMKKSQSTEKKLQQLKWEMNPGNLEIDMRSGEKLQQVNIFMTGGRIKQEFKLSESGAELELLMIVIGSGKNLLNLVCQINHLARETRARVTVKAVLFDQSQLEFRGNLAVAKEAHGTDTYLRCESLLMSHQAVAKTIPALEIIANDVKAGHAATVGRVDEDNLFYLESRGLPRATALQMLLEAFLAETKNFFTDLSEEQREELSQKIVNLLPKSNE